MTAEHIARFVLPAEWGVALSATLLGRIAFPLFAAMVAWHLVYNTRDPIRYASRMLVIACVAQLPYLLLFDAVQLNVVFTLAVGVVIACFSPLLWRLFAALVLLVVALVWFDSFEYGLPGVLLVPSLVAALRYSGRYWWLDFLPLAVAWTLNPSWLFSLVAVLPVLLVVLLRDGLVRLPSIPRMPRGLWLSWYPLHLVVIIVLANLPPIAFT